MSISSSTNEWPQVDEVSGLMASSGRIMEKPTGQEQALKCPRCDSSNTKFCYYNNYSLSQPRHFCKACKRYWTRGGTLRNVPVGGGCRKNKRVKRSSSSSSTSSSLDPSSSLPSATNTTNASPTATNTTTTTSSLGNQGNPLFYGIPNSSADINLTLPSFQNIKNVPSSCTGYDLQPHQFSDLGLGFTSAAMTSASQVQDVIASNPLLSSFNSLLGSNSSYSSTCPLTTPLVASTLQQQQNSIMGDLKNSRTNRFQALLPFRDLQTRGQSDESNNPGMILKELKVEEANNKTELYGTCQNPMELFNTLDSSIYWNNTTNFGSWPDLTNYGSSVTPLI